MTDAFIDTFSGLEARMKIVDAITNNLANANTAGFKRDFGFILENETRIDAATQVDLAPGDLVPTANPLDVAINGPGFFAIETSNGERYMRSGNLGVNAAGELVNKDSSHVSLSRV